MPLAEGGSHKRGGKLGAASLKRCYSTVIGSFNVKWLHQLILIFLMAEK